MPREKTLNASDLDQFTGSDNWYQHGIVRRISYTDGAKYVADTAGAYWLLDEIALAQLDKRMQVEEFQVWKLTVADSVGELTCGDGNGNLLVKKPIPYTDFPLPEIELWFENNVICLPSER